MKKKAITIGGILLVAVLIIVSVKYFRNGNPFAGSSMEEAQSLDAESGDLQLQDEEPDEEIHMFAKRLEEDLLLKYNSSKEITKEQLAEHPVEVDPWKVTTVGKEIRGSDFSYRVNHWGITQELPYQYKEGSDSETMKKYYQRWYQIEWDEEGNIRKGGCYITVNVTVKNLEDQEISELLWAYFRLKKFGEEDSIPAEEVLFLGEEVMLPRGEKDYYRETLPAKGEKTVTLIFLATDRIQSEVEQGNPLYLEINPSGMMRIDSSFRWIVLNK